MMNLAERLVLTRKPIGRKVPLLGFTGDFSPGCFFFGYREG